MPDQQTLTADSSEKVSNRDKILDAAEIEFAAHGYEGCSLRTIASSSGVNLGLIHYYFGGKQDLFSEVFQRRAKLLVRRRKILLETARVKYGTSPIPIEELVRCFITPTIEMIAQGEGPKAFIRLHSRLRTEQRNFDRDLRRRAFNDSNIQYIEAFHESCPHLSPEAVVWRFTAMVGSYLFIISQSGRVQDLSGGRCDPNDIEQAMATVLPFIVAGFQTPEHGTDSD